MAKTKATPKAKAANVAQVKRLWASVNHSPIQVLEFCNKLSERNFEGKLRSQIIMPDDVRTSSFDDDAHIWIVVSSQTLELLKEKRVNMSKVTVIIVDNVVLATQYQGIVLLDCKQTRSYQFKFQPLDSEMVLSLREGSTNTSVDINAVRVDILPELLNAQPPSVLSPVMTYIYTIPDTDKRSKYLADIFNCIQTQQSITKLDWFKRDNKKMSDLNDWLEGDIGKKACIDISNALNKVKPTDGDKEFKQLADEFGVAKFDINYAVLFIKRNNSVTNPNETTDEMYRRDLNNINYQPVLNEGDV
jgi:hypothetical protein